ncbi:MAG: membrane protein insertion efficiency factor YidD [Nitrospirae bacterium]|nr:membrane protein insertion efficiency factor YidD [Candidatus Troglogloeales bacterium]
MTSVFIFLIRIYQRLLSPLHPPVCRFYPTCSHYSIAAVRRHGMVSGLFLTIKRLIRCSPFSQGGYDPIQ